MIKFYLHNSHIEFYSIPSIIILSSRKAQTTYSLSKINHFIFAFKILWLVNSYGSMVVKSKISMNYTIIQNTQKRKSLLTMIFYYVGCNIKCHFRSVWQQKCCNVAPNCGIRIYTTIYHTNAVEDFPYFIDPKKCKINWQNSLLRFFYN